MLELGILKTFDSEAHTAGVQLVGSLTTYLDNIAVATNIAVQAMITGNYVLVAIPGGNPRDACVVASWPQGSSGGGGGASGEGHITINPFAYDSIGQGTWAYAPSTSYFLNGIWYNSSGNQGDNITYKVYLDAGTYTILMLSSHIPNGAIVRIYIDADLVAEFDRYSAGITRNERFVDTGNVIATAGLKAIKIEAYDKNPSAGSYEAGFTYIALWRTA